MRVFVTGATGFIGFAIVKGLMSAGHEVTGLARSAASGKKLASAGARVHRGDVEDLECLRRAAAAADGAVHTAFYHKISHIPLGTRLGVLLGGAPSGIVTRFLSAVVAMDRRALAGPDRPLVATFGTLSLKPEAWPLRMMRMTLIYRSRARQDGGFVAEVGWTGRANLSHPPSANRAWRRRSRFRADGD